ncbi:MAG: hypothetical protein ACI4RA_01625 [Kiritimatiellia bacterium]
MATAEYIGAKRRAYAASDRAKRRRILDEVCETTGYSRKYANRLLTGSRTFREHKGRGRTYTEEAAAVLKRVWTEAGCPCPPYFKAEIGRWLDEFSSEVAHIRPEDKEMLLRMSDRTMSRILSGEKRVKPGWSKANKRSGRGSRNEMKSLTPCASGEAVMAREVPPGDVQIDTFALGGGDPSDGFFWILDATDRKTQWTELAPTWNRGREATLQALMHMESRLPFDMVSLHSDNGGEILNHHVAAYLGDRPKSPFLWRSRPRHSNDNAHVEEKNRSSGRQLFGEIRLDCRALQDELVKLCDDWSDFRNFFCPCKMLMGKERRPDGKGHRCTYDKPKTPCQRLLDENVLTPGQREALKARRAGTSGMALYRRVLRRLRKIRRMQEQYSAARHGGKDLPSFAASPALALRATPSGTAGLCREGRPHARDRTRQKRVDERTKSVQYLANQKTPSHLQSVFPI